MVVSISVVKSCMLCCLAFASATYAQSDDDVGASSREVTFDSGDVNLAGTLLIPSGEGPFPGVVIVHGSGTSDRSNPWTAAYADALMERGIAVLHPDKRGSGQSGGTWRDASFVELAEDAIAALELLRADPSVNSERVGFIGFSQGGHVAPVAATRTSFASFVIDVSGSVVPIMEQISDELRKMGQREGLSENDLATVQLLHERAVHFVLTGENWASYSEVLAEAREGALGETDVVKGFPKEPNSSAWHFLQTIGEFDPLPFWRSLGVPSLFLYGGKDENVDVFKSVALINDSLMAGGLPYTLLLFKDSGHALYREDAMDFIAGWIQRAGSD